MQIRFAHKPKNRKHMAQTLKLIYHAAKVRLGFLIMACAMAGIAVSPGNELASWQVLVLGLAVLVSSSVSGAFNQLYERDLDARMKRTRKRAFVTGKLQANWYWMTALVLLLLVSLVVAALATNIEAAVYIFLGRVHIRHRLHGLAQDANLDEYRDRRAGRKFCRHGRCGRDECDARNGAVDPGAGFVPVDAAAFLGTGLRLQERLCGRRRADAACCRQ